MKWLLASKYRWKTDWEKIRQPKRSELIDEAIYFQMAIAEYDRHGEPKERPKRESLESWTNHAAIIITMPI